MAHWEGSPDCSENCNGPHLDDDFPHGEVCEGCGGNGRACRFGCVEARSNRRYESFEGRTGAQEMLDLDTEIGW